MSQRSITIKVEDGQTLFCLVDRKSWAVREKGGFARLGRLTGEVKTEFTVQYGYGGGMYGTAPTLKEAVADLHRRWAFFCANRHEIEAGRVEMI